MSKEELEQKIRDAAEEHAGYDRFIKRLQPIPEMIMEGYLEGARMAFELGWEAAKKAVLEKSEDTTWEGRVVEVIWPELVKEMTMTKLFEDDPK